MTIQIGDKLPAGHLTEMILDETPGCPAGPHQIDVPAAAAGKKIIVFGLPGAFTPTCSARHAPSYIQLVDQLKAKGIDEIWCISVNDAYVMGAWGRELGATGKVRMMADGSAAYTRALGLDVDLTARDMGVRSRRYSMLVDNGVVRALHVEAPGKYEVSDAQSMLTSL